MKIAARFVSLILLVSIAACGKKGPPQPPLVRIPTPPADFAAERRGAEVTIHFVVPGGNTDGSTPADLTHVDVYALNAPAPIVADEIFRRGARIGRVLANPPPDPDTPEGQPPKPSAPPPPGGIDQGATTSVLEKLTTAETTEPSDTRFYVGVGFNKRGRRGFFSVPAAVSLAPPPAPPGKPDVSYDEKTITLTWPEPQSPSDDVTLTYHVYLPGDVPTRLTPQPLGEAMFVDEHIEWGSERCYIVRSVETLDKMSLESEPSPSTCVTPTDTFPPAPPQGLTVVASEGGMNLIWNANTEADLAGYVLWRSMPAEAASSSITPEPIKETTFHDTVPAGTQVAYTVQAVDKAGNMSPLSERVEETAR